MLLKEGTIGKANVKFKNKTSTFVMHANLTRLSKYENVLFCPSDIIDRNSM